MGQYGTEILDDNNNVLGYKISDNKAIVVKKSSTKLGEECNLVTIKSIDNINDKITIKNIDDNINNFINWIDIKKGDGFVRVQGNTNYYFNNNYIYKVINNV